MKYFKGNTVFKKKKKTKRDEEGVSAMKDI